MKFQIKFKTPDVSQGLTEEQFLASEKLRDKYIQFDEYIKIEFDTEKETVTVIPFKF